MFKHLPTAGLLALATLFVSLDRSSAQAPQVVNPEPGITVQGRGPVHEAFAQPVETNPPPGLAVPQQPPAAIPEAPPEQRPAGDQAEWVPGYWSWDAERREFLWVSGCWRVPPPDRRWVPGHWDQVNGEWQWTPGLWASAQQPQPQYLPQPPASLDNGPSTSAPDDNSVYVPGCWVFRNTQFVWRPGYWLTCQPGWTWTPAHYCATPSGYLYVSGYWDYPLEDRGLLFAPVSFTQPLWNTPGWCYRPSYTVGLDGLLASLFVQPAYGHYYFGDYYGPAYGRLGYRPWIAYGPRHYDPLFGYYHWRHRDNPSWYGGLRDTFWARHDGTVPRPPRTLADQHAFLRSAGGRQNFAVNNNAVLLNSINQVHATNYGRLGNGSAGPWAERPSPGRGAVAGTRSFYSLPPSQRLTTPAPAGFVAGPGRSTAAAISGRAVPAPAARYALRAPVPGRSFSPTAAPFASPRLSPRTVSSMPHPVLPSGSMRSMPTHSMNTAHFAPAARPSFSGHGGGHGAPAGHHH